MNHEQTHDHTSPANKPPDDAELIERAARGDLTPELAKELERREAADPNLREQRERAARESAKVAEDANRLADTFDYTRTRRIVRALSNHDELEVKTVTLIFPLFFIIFAALLIHQAADRDALHTAITTALVAILMGVIVWMRTKRRAERSRAAANADDAALPRISASLTDRFERIWIRSLISNASSFLVFSAALAIIIETGPRWVIPVSAGAAIYFAIATARLIAAPARSTRRLQREMLDFLDDDDNDDDNNNNNNRDERPKRKGGSQ